MIITNDMLPSIIRKKQPKRKAKPMRFSLPAGYHEWQKMLITSDIKLQVYPCATKVGKTLGGSSRLISKSWQGAQGLDYVARSIAPTVALTRLTYQYLSRLLPENFPQPKDMSSDDYAKINDTWQNFVPDRSEHKGIMKWAHNQAVIECVHGDNPEVTIEGARVHLNCFDEAAKLKRQVFDSAVSTTTQTNGINVLYGTPRGKNWYFEKFKECQEYMRWAVKKGLHLNEYEMFAMQARTIDNPFVPRETIARAKKYLTDRHFRQLYMAEFLDDGSVFVGHRDCIYGDEIEIPEEKRIQQWVHPDADTKDVVLGVDWAKRQDYYVAIAWDVTSEIPRIIGFQRCTGVSYKKCVSLLYQFSQSFNEVTACRHDRTGVGDVIDEMLQPLPFPIEPVVFSNSIKCNMVEAYMVAVEQGEVEIPNWSELIKEHDNFDVSTTALGLPKYEAVDGEHDDIIMAIILGFFAVCEVRDNDFSVRILEDLKSEDIEKEETDYLNSLIDEFEYDDDNDF